MKVICAVKYVPDVDKFQFDFENNTVIRQNIRMILNPDDAKTVGLALEMKKSDSSIQVEILCMGPQSVLPMVKDLARMGVDQVTLLSDSRFVGSDSYVTSKILGRYLKTQTPNLILTGNHSLDGDTSHVPSQIADYLGYPQMSNVVEVAFDRTQTDHMVFSVENETKRIRFSSEMPCVLSLSKDAPYKLPYISYEDMNKDVDQKIKILGAEDLTLDVGSVGHSGSLTKVNRTFVKEYRKRDRDLLKVDADGIEKIYQFLQQHGYIGGKADEE